MPRVTWATVLPPYASAGSPGWELLAMNGFALLLLAATVGVEYDWRTTEDGQIEYVLIVEPDFIPSLADGSEIRSSVPPELEHVHRLCIRIAPPANSAMAPRPET